MSCNHQPQWTLADCNEDGWKCAECGIALGFRPDFDREHTREKVDVVLVMLHESDFVYVSNSTMADLVAARVVQKCHNADTYDQQSIIVWIIESLSSTHVAFWREQAKQAMCSHPSRGLCTDGKTLKCNACGHEAKIKTDSGPLFGEEPF